VHVVVISNRSENRESRSEKEDVMRRVLAAAGSAIFLVASTILGQRLVFGNVRVLAYGAVVWLLFHLFVLIYEEPTLRATFGREYEIYCSEVPRWIPRFF